MPPSTMLVEKARAETEAPVGDMATSQRQPAAVAGDAERETWARSGRAAPPWVAASAWRITTIPGSVYVVRRDLAGAWWLSAENVRTPRSRSLADGGWQIDPPWPWLSVLGFPVWLCAPAHLEHGDPRRVPGGGKSTSSVIEVHRAPLDGASPSESQEERP